MRRLPVFLIGALAVLPAARLLTAQTVTEPGSGVAFPLTLAAADGSGDHALMGTGLRTKTMLKVKVYAFGLYVDSAAARAALAPYAGKDLRTLQKDETFYGDLVKHTFGATLRLVMTRDVDGETMAEAFDEALRPRVVRAAAELNMPGGEEALATFRGYFGVSEMTKTSELVFTCSPDGTLASRVKGEDKPAIASPALCWALFDVYLGRNPISGDGKKTVIANFPALLAAGT
jgi:hypothetical protein